MWKVPPSTDSGQKKVLTTKAFFWFLPSLTPCGIFTLFPTYEQNRGNRWQVDRWFDKVIFPFKDHGQIKLTKDIIDDETDGATRMPVAKLCDT
jgi:hypothetical protein